MGNIAFIQPYDRPWTNPGYVAGRQKMYISRTPFEVGFQVPEEHWFCCLDLNLELRTGKDLESSVSDFISHYQPEIVMLTMPVYVLGDQIDIIVKTVKRVRPASKIILGGSEVSLVHDLPLQLWKDIECCYNGYGCEIPELLEACLTDKQPVISGVYWRGTSNVATKGKKELVDGYSALDFYTIKGRFDFAHYLWKVRDAGLYPMGTIEMTRGCSFRCDFCAINGVRQGLHHRSPQVVASEAHFLATYGVKYIHLIDPTFGLDRERQDELLIELQKVHQKFPDLGFEILTRPELVTEDFAQAIKVAGVVRCAIGMETMDGIELSGVGKTLKPNRTEEAARYLAESGVETKLFHIVFPGNLSTNTIAFFLKLSSEGLPFIVQSSFLRVLANPKSSHRFISQDQTIYNLGVDTEEQLMEFILANLAFPSMDVGGGGDPKLRRRIAKTLSRGGSLKELFTTKNGGQTVELRRSLFDKYVYSHSTDFSVTNNLNQ